MKMIRLARTISDLKGENTISDESLWEAVTLRKPICRTSQPRKDAGSMCRKPRVWNSSRFYHIVCRRNHREALFVCPGDYKTFLYILSKTHQNFPFELPAYCLMTNHFHLMLRSKEHSISKIMSLVNKRYADYYNTRYRLKGHLFEKRFYSHEITDDEGILQVSRYIHRNPLEARMVQNLEDYHGAVFLSI